MRYIKQLSLVIILSIILIGCSSTSGNYREVNGVPVKVERNRIEDGDYQLDYSFFKKRDLPIPNSFKGKSIEYLVVRNDTLKKYGYDFFDEYDEKEALKFFKDLDVRGYGDNSPHWRWKVSIDKDDFFTAIENNLSSVYRGRPSEVLTLSNGEWKSLNITDSSIGKVKNVEVAARGRSGVVTYLLITTTKNKYLVAKELNIRKVFALNKRRAESDKDILMYGAKGGSGKYQDSPIRKNITLLPSAYFAIEYDGGKVNIYGGGYGHGVGMAQYTAYDLAQNHKYDYEDILTRSYPNADLKNMYSLKGVGKTINVGITNSFRGMDHSKVILSSNGKMKIDGAGFKIDVPPKEKVVIVNKGNRLWVSVNGKHRVKTVNPLDITAYGYYITIEDLKRGHTSMPRYRGDMIVKPSKTSSTGIRVVNRVKIEDYLKQVVPSEMPQSFGLEALKAQAVAARTYALSDYLKNRYAADGFHVKDTTESQVYNNAKENDNSTKAIEATSGKVLMNNGKPIDAKYFSTSAGFLEAANYIW